MTATRTAKNQQLLDNQHNNFARASRFFVHFSVVSYNVKIPRTERKTTIGLMSKKTTLHVRHAFLYITFAFTSQPRREMTKF